MLKRTKYYSLLIALFMGAAVSYSSQDTVRDDVIRPIIVLPSDDEIDSGDPIAIKVVMDDEADSATTVYLQSSHPNLIAVPGTTTIQTGMSQSAWLEISGYSEGPELGSTVVEITATANGQAVSCEVTVH